MINKEKLKPAYDNMVNVFGRVSWVVTLVVGGYFMGVSPDYYFDLQQLLTITVLLLVAHIVLYMLPWLFENPFKKPLKEETA